MGDQDPIVDRSGLDETSGEMDAIVTVEDECPDPTDPTDDRSGEDAASYGVW